MQKKEYLLKILTQLEPVRDLASWLKVVVEMWDLWDDLLNTIMEAISAWIHSAKSEIAKEKMTKWLNALEKMKQIEQESLLEDEKELAKLDELINNF